MNRRPNLAFLQFESALLLVFSALFLCFSWGCGSRQGHVGRPAYTIEWQGAYGGPYVASCRTGGVIWAARHQWIEHWKIKPDRPIQTARIKIKAEGAFDRITSLSCSANAVKATTTKGTVVILDGAGHPVSTPDTQWHPGQATRRLGSTSESVAAADLQLIIHENGRGVFSKGNLKDWRPVPSGFIDAVYDGRHVWAISFRYLWRWTPNTERFMSIALPDAVGQRRLEGVFRDGALLWLRTSDGLGWPLHIMGSLARLAGKPGPLPPEDHAIRLSFAGKHLRREHRGGPLFISNETIKQQPWQLPGVTTVLPIDQRQVLVSTSERIRLLDMDASAQSVGPAWSVGEEMIRFFLDERSIYALGRDGTIYVGRLKPSGPALRAVRELKSAKSDK
ncbi:MAG: hypothetical protein VX589_06350 [Myxococcota bacterium]|nr:hypothetical protein [Myxococcota bacterium]